MATSYWAAVENLGFRRRVLEARDGIVGHGTGQNSLAALYLGPWGAHSYVIGLPSGEREINLGDCKVYLNEKYVGIFLHNSLYYTSNPSQGSKLLYIIIQVSK